MVMLTRTPVSETISAEGAPADLYAAVIDALEAAGGEEIARRWAGAGHRVKLDSFTFCNDPPEQAPVPTDWVPRLIHWDEWEHLAAGVAQRLAALNRFLLDTYCGTQTIVPEDVVFSGKYFRPELQGTRPPGDVFVHIYGIDLVHLGDGEYRVLEDNLRVPSGIAYQLKALEIAEQHFPDLRRHYNVVPYEIRATYRSLFASLTRMDEPNVVLLTDGKHGTAFFEHRYLSDLLDIPLVEGHDLYVDSAHRVWCRTIDGDRPVHVIYRRVEDLELFVPGLTEAYRQGTVALINAPGAGAADDKLVFRWVPDMIRHYLGEEPIIAQAHSYYLRSPDDYRAVMANLDNLVLKTRDGYGGLGVYILPDLSTNERSEACRAMLERPDAFIAQEMLEFSRHLVYDDEVGWFNERYVDLRVYAVQDANGIMVFPGGLTRVARKGSRVTNNSSGGACKPTWVVT
jgi:uncharacterized circularly permuted ATP-grasp superfamily protein